MTTERQAAMDGALRAILHNAMSHPCFDGELFESRDLKTLAKVGGDICDWTMIAILADDGLKGTHDP